MLCNICENKEAVIHVKQMAGDKVSELHLCASCATEKGFLPKDDASEFSLSQLLTTLLDISGYSAKEYDETISCQNCGTTIREFRNSEKLGCEDCFNVFASDIDNFLRNKSDKIKHIGKLPKKIGKLKRIIIDKEVLKDKLQTAVDEENYELAAVLRDRIKNFENKSGEENDSPS